jgi:hypothetical protein
MVVRFRIEGTDRAAAADELQRLLEDELGIEPERVEVPVSEHDGRKGDPVAIAALILAVPGAVLATMDLAQRMRLREKIGKLIATAQTLRADDKASVQIETATAAQPLDQATVDRVIEMASEET